MNGILIINKPVGVSSFYYMKKVQKKLNLPKVGHLGTLDPLADGVLVLLCGRATKLNQELSAKTKTYQSTFTFGIETTTLDSEGEVVATSDVIPTVEQIQSELKNLVGELQVQVPKFSAVHINGKRAYDLARQGVDFVPPTKTMTIHRFELIKESPFVFEIECSTGTYIRSLAQLLAGRLGTVAIASTITRTRIGDWDIKESKNLEDVTIDDIACIS